MKLLSQITSLVALLFFALLLPASGQDQSSITGGLSGAVVDATGAAVPGAVVTIVGPQGTKKYTTDGKGQYTASGLRPGFYDVAVEKEGFNKVQAKHSEVTVSTTSTLNLTLTVGNDTTTIEVTSTAVQIDTNSTAITSTLTDTFYNMIPMQRNVSALFYAAPGVAGGQVAGSANATGPGASNPSIGGSSALENLYVVDGVTITDQAFGSIGTFNRYHGALGAGINLAFVKEVDVKTAAFEPQYGKSLGGILLIDTKSGGNQYHGAVGAYFAPAQFYASRYQFYQFGYTNTTPLSTLSQPAFDASVEFGGYVPHFKDKLFFFGAWDPSLNQERRFANPSNAITFAHGEYDYSTTSASWAGKLTYKLGSRTTLEASSFGDPTRHNAVPNTLSTNDPKSVTSSYDYGSRDSIARIDSAITPSWTVDASYAYNHNHFSESPQSNAYGITDSTRVYNGGAAIASGFGAYEPSINNTYSIAANTSKIVHLFGQHTFSAGYAYDHTDFLDKPTRSGDLFAIPGKNANGDTLTDLYKNIPAGAVGQLTNASFSIAAANTHKDANGNYDSLGDTTCAQCPLINGVRSYASISRGTYKGLSVNAIGRYHSAYGNDVYEMNRFVTIDAGVRWEQQRVGGTLLDYTFTGNWSPRIGINIDPMGDHKSKLFFNYSRDYWALPLDAAIRQLGNEQDDTSYYFVPTVAADGTITVQTDAAHTLNGLVRSTDPTTGAVSKFGAPNFSSSTGEGIIPGTKSEYIDEYVIGFERNVGSSIVLKARYTDRRLLRVIEDIGSQSPEGAIGLIPNYNGGIANPGPGIDIAVNEQEVTYGPNAFAAANHPADGKVTPENYVPTAPGCTYGTDTGTPAGIGTNFLDSLNKPVGGACFLNADTADAGPGDGISDGFVKPVRRYNAVEFEVVKRFSNHWLADANFKWGTLYGNYEGAYRNDNAQSDPGISSLFDFTAGKLGLLGPQFTPGDLSSDRRTVGNIFLSYNIGSDTPFVHGAKGLTVGMGARGQSGVPLTKFGDHPIYLNQGEIPVGGRGSGGRTPAATSLDMHLDYPVPMGSRFSERYKLKLAMDMFNVTNSQFETGRVQYLQTPNSGGTGSAPPLNADYGRPTSFQGPFYARGSIRFEF